MSKFKKGDYIFVKYGVEIDDFGKAENWGGKITEVDGSGDLISIQLDAQTLQQLTDAYLSITMENGEDFLEYNFLKDDLVLGERRDSDADYKAAVAKIHNRLDVLDVLDDDDDFEDEEVVLARLEGWAEAFGESDLVKGLSAKDQQDATFVANTFVSYCWRGIGEMPNEWNAATVQEVCFYYIVGKVAIPAKDFENHGRILAVFFQYLEEEGHIADSKEIQETALEIAPQIVKRAGDPRNWHMAKSMLMPGVAQGEDLSDEDTLDAYLRRQQSGALNAASSNYQPIQTIKNTKKIGRNDKVSVKYSDGKIVKDVKYKKVMRDVESGKCEVI